MFIHIFFENYLTFWGFLCVPHLVDIYAKMWMSGVGTLCANSHYRAFLFDLKLAILEPTEIFIDPSNQSRDKSVGQHMSAVTIQTKRKKQEQKLNSFESSSYCNFCFKKMR